MLNEAFGWTLVLVGLLAGLVLGLGFHREGWLGGYVFIRRRLIRLAHISLVALGILNILFVASADRIVLGPKAVSVASWSFLVGGISMPVCCLLAAWRIALRQLFAVPVLSLVLGTGLVVWGIWR